MIIAGTVLAIGLIFAFTVVFGPYGAWVLIALLFGLVLSTHQRNKQIYDDLQKIKQKLGIEDKDEFNMSNEEIEEELALIDITEQSELSELDKQIEQELEEIYQKSEEDEGKTKT
jgi:cell division protein FtsB